MRHRSARSSTREGRLHSGLESNRDASGECSDPGRRGMACACAGVCRHAREIPRFQRIRTARVRIRGTRRGSWRKSRPWFVAPSSSGSTRGVSSAHLGLTRIWSMLELIGATHREIRTSSARVTGVPAPLTPGTLSTALLPARPAHQVRWLANSLDDLRVGAAGGSRIAVGRRSRMPTERCRSARVVGGDSRAMRRVCPVRGPRAFPLRVLL